MNVLTFLFARYIKSGRYGRAMALLPLLSKMGFRRFATEAYVVLKYLASGKASKKELAILVAAILYFVSPLSLIPVIGLADDLVIATMLAAYLHRKATASNKYEVPIPSSSGAK